MTSNDSTETASVDELRAIQLVRMREALHHVYERVPHTRSRFDAMGVHPDDLLRLEDIAKFPLTAKDDLRRNYPFGMFAEPMEKIVRIHASSGIISNPTVVCYTR